MSLENLKGLYIAHRGIKTDTIIEHTIPAFSLALKKNVPIELDIHLLKDGNIVVYHDNDLRILMGINRKISSYSYNELKKLTFPNTNTQIPLLSDVFNLIKGKVLLVIEIKRTTICNTQKYCQKIVKLLKQYPYEIIIQSFDIKIVHWFLKHTNYITGLLISHPSGKNLFTLYSLITNTNLLVSLLNPDFISVNYRIASSKMVQKFRKEKPVLVWTIHDQNQLEKVKPFADSYFVGDFYFKK